VPTDDLFPAGYTLGRHRIEQRLRDGGMATIYLGHHVATEAKVAIKVLHRPYATAPEFVARFAREAQVMGRLSGCPHIVAVHDVGRLPDGRGYLVMEYVRGRDLDDILAELGERRMAIVRTCQIMRDVAFGVDTAHRQQIVHRDVKPPNVMIEDHRGRETAKILDFGISADLGVKGQAQGLTAIGAVIGTPEYMAPEQATGAKASPSFDIYAMGIMMFEMLTGRAPPVKGWRAGTLPPVSTLRPDVPPALERLVAEALRLDASARIQSASEVAERLNDILESWDRSDPEAMRGQRLAGESVITLVSLPLGPHRPSAVPTTPVHPSEVPSPGFHSTIRTAPAPLNPLTTRPRALPPQSLAYGAIPGSTPAGLDAGSARYPALAHPRTQPAPGKTRMYTAGQRPLQPQVGPGTQAANGAVSAPPRLVEYRPSERTTDGASVRRNAAPYRSPLARAFVVLAISVGALGFFAIGAAGAVLLLRHFDTPIVPSDIKRAGNTP